MLHPPVVVSRDGFELKIIGASKSGASKPRGDSTTLGSVAGESRDDVQRFFSTRPWHCSRDDAWNLARDSALSYEFKGTAGVGSRPGFGRVPACRVNAADEEMASAGITAEADHRSGISLLLNPAQSAASLSFFNARVLILTVAGFAANTRSTLVNGSIPVRFFFAGTLMTFTFRRPGSVNEPSPFL